MISYFLFTVYRTHKNVKLCSGQLVEVLLGRYYEKFMHKNSQAAGKRQAVQDPILSVSESFQASLIAFVSEKSFSPLYFCTKAISND